MTKNVSKNYLCVYYVYGRLYILIILHDRKMSSNITKHISFPPALFAKIKANAEDFGVSIAEYIRYLAMNDSVKKIEYQKHKVWEESLPVYTATDEKWKAWDKARKDNGVILTPEEFKDRFQNV